MRILTGFRVQLNRFAFGVDLALPNEDFYDFPLFAVIFHECPKDYTFNIAIIGIDIHFTWIRHGRRY